jgi:hypothetical protein
MLFMPVCALGNLLVPGRIAIGRLVGFISLYQNAFLAQILCSLSWPHTKTENREQRSPSPSHLPLRTLPKTNLLNPHALHPLPIPLQLINIKHQHIPLHIHQHETRHIPILLLTVP